MTILAFSPPAPAPCPQPPVRCLVAESEPAMRAILLGLARNLGFETAEAAGATEAFARCVSFRPEIVLLDWQLSGCDGSEFIAHLRNSESSLGTHIVVLDEGRDNETVALDAGANDFLAKPLQARPLAARLGSAGRAIMARRGLPGGRPAPVPPPGAYAAILRAVLDHASIGILATHPNGRVAFANRALCQAIGMPEQRLLAADDPAALLAPAAADEYHADNTLAQTRAGAHRGRATLRLADGRHCHVPVTRVRYLDNHGRPGVVTLTAPLGESDQQATELAASAFADSGTPMLLAEQSGRIVIANAAMTAMCDSAAIALQYLDQLDGDLTEIVRQAIASQQAWRGELTLARRDSPPLLLLACASPLPPDGGHAGRCVVSLTDLTDIRRRQGEIEHLAYFDALTDLPNRVLFTDRLHIAHAQASRSSAMLAVAYFDLDGFKGINDGHGHAAGDRLLQEIARRLRGAIRSGDTVARIGGDEFALLLPLAAMDDCHMVMTRILDAVAQPVRLDDKRLHVTASIGIAIAPLDGSTPEELLNHADQALYATKASGKNGYRLYDSGYDHSLRLRQEILTSVEQALNAGEMRLAFRPFVDLRRARVIGVEACPIWPHPEIGAIGPEVFLPALRGSALEIRLGEHLLREGLAQQARWHEQGQPLTLAVQLSPDHLLQHDFLPLLRRLLGERSRATTSRLQIRINHAALASDLDQLAQVFGRCHDLGVEMVIEGVSGDTPILAALRRLPQSSIALDPALVEGITRHRDDQSTVEGLLAVTRAFRRNILAAGVGSAEQGVRLLEMGCDRAQGSAIAGALAADELMDWLAAWRNDPLFPPAADVAAASPLPMLMDRSPPA